MGFTSETAREAGRKSKRGKDNFSDEIKRMNSVSQKGVQYDKENRRSDYHDN